MKFLPLLLLLMSCQKEALPLIEKRCVTDERHDWLIPQQVGISEQLPKTHKVAGAIVIPVVVHVIHHGEPIGVGTNISDAQIQSQIKALNDDFARKNADTSQTPNAFKRIAGSTNIRFCLDTVVRKYSSRTSWGADGAVKLSSYGGDDAWDCEQWLNIWVCNTSGFLGYANYPGGNPIADGIVVKYSAFGTVGTLLSNYNKGRTATHEVGHWLNLYHTFWPNCGDDLISDTPLQSTANYSCPVYPKLEACSPTAPGVMFMNYMDYSYDYCMNSFTNVQCKRMVNTVVNVRSTFVSNFTCP